MNIAIYLACPFQETPKVGAFVPNKLPKFQKADIFHFYAAVGFHAPKQIGTAPRRKPVAPCGVPPEADHRRHRIPLKHHTNESLQAANNTRLTTARQGLRRPGC